MKVRMRPGRGRFELILASRMVSNFNLIVGVADLLLFAKLFCVGLGKAFVLPGLFCSLEQFKTYEALIEKNQAERIKQV